MVTPDDRQAEQQRRIIDASVHVFFESNGDLRSYMQEPFRSRGIPDVEMDWYGAPGGEYVRWAERPGMYPGSDPEFAGEQLFGERGVDIAILHPMTRGCGPDRHLVSAVLAAHNEMLARRWLENDRFGERYRGTIRLNPEDIEGALKELDRWREHPRMVQIGVPLQSHTLYGKPQFFPLWEAAADAGLPAQDPAVLLRLPALDVRRPAVGGQAPARADAREDHVPQRHRPVQAAQHCPGPGRPEAAVLGAARLRSGGAARRTVTPGRAVRPSGRPGRG